MKEKWFEVKASTDLVEFNILTDIGSGGITAEDFINELTPFIGKNLHLNINSGGGSVFNGSTIYTFLKKNFPDLITENLGLVASIASVIFLAGKTRIVNQGSFIMVHNPWVDYAGGEAKDLLKMADMLEAITDEMKQIYIQETGLDEKTITKMMDETTWITSQEAINLGFATEIRNNQTRLSASIKDLKNCPVEVRAMLVEPKAEETIPVVEEVVVSNEKEEVIEQEVISNPQVISEIKEKNETTVSDKNKREIQNMENTLPEANASIPADVMASIAKPSTVEDKLAKMSVRDALMTMTTSGATPKEVSQIFDLVYELNPFRKIATVFPAVQGDAIIPVPTGLGSGGYGAEGATITPADASLTNATFSPFPYYGGITVANDFLNSNWLNAKDWLAKVIAGTISEAETTAMLGSGAGASAPQGIFNKAIDLLTATTATLAVADVVGWINALETKYRNGNEVMIMSPSTFSAIYNLKDNTGKIDIRYVGSDVFLNGVRVIQSSLAPAYSTVANTKLIAYGRFDLGYGIVDRADSFKVLQVQNVNAFTSNVLFQVRHDGRALNTSAFKILAMK